MLVSYQIPVTLVTIWFMYQECVIGKICNVALCRPTNQSSLLPGFDFNFTQSCNAVDGVSISEFSQQTCMATNQDYDPFSFWQVDLGDMYNVTHVNISLREAAGDEYKKVSDTRIYVGTNVSEDGTLIDPQLCAQYLSGPGLSDIGQPLSISCSTPMMAHYVKIVKDSISGNFLSFCEFQVFAQVTQSTCPDPPLDWSCRDLQHTSVTPRTECLSGYMAGELTTDTLTTAVATTSIQTSTKMDVVTTGSATTTTVTTHEYMTTKSITTIKSTTSSNLDTTTSNIDSHTTTSYTTAQTCYCPCSSGGFLVLTDAELKEKIEKLISDIKIDPKATSNSKRKLISVDDSRPSAKAVGSLGIIILILCCSLIVIMDSDIIYRHIEKCKARKIKEQTRVEEA